MKSHPVAWKRKMSTRGGLLKAWPNVAKNAGAEVDQSPAEVQPTDTCRLSRLGVAAASTFVGKVLPVSKHDRKHRVCFTFISGEMCTFVVRPVLCVINCRSVGLMFSSVSFLLDLIAFADLENLDLKYTGFLSQIKVLSPSAIFLLVK